MHDVSLSVIVIIDGLLVTGFEWRLQSQNDLGCIWALEERTVVQLNHHRYASSPIFPLFHTISCHLTILRIHGYVRLMQSRSHLGYASRREATESMRAKCGDCDDLSDVLGAYQIHACSLRLEDTNSAGHHALQELRPSTHKGYTGIAHKRRCWQF